MAQPLEKEEKSLLVLRAKIGMKLLGIFAMLGVLGFSVFAASLQQLHVSNTVNFVSNHVLATIVANVSGNAGDEIETYHGSVNAQDLGEGEEQGVYDLETWAVGYLGFAHQDHPIVFTILITNDSAQRAIRLSVNGYFYQAMNGPNMYSLKNPALPDEESNRNYTNITRSLTYQGQGMETPQVWDGIAKAEYDIAPLATAKIEVQVKIVDAGLSVNGFINNFFVELNNVTA